MLVDQEDNIPDQSRSFEEDDVIIGKEWQEVFQCNAEKKPMINF